MDEKSCEPNSVCAKILAETTDFLEKTHSHLSSLSSDPLFSSIVTLYVLVLLYFPGIVFLPELISTAILLLTLLRIGATQRGEERIDSIELEELIRQESITEKDFKWVSSESNLEPGIEVGLGLDFDPGPFYVDSFVEWNVRAPLEVIYEEYEGEEDDQNDGVPEVKRGTPSLSIQRYPSLSLCYPETDSDSSSGGDYPAIGEWESPDDLYFRLEEEDKEGLIEIALDGNRTSEVFHVEEDNLIEIDISPARTPARMGHFPGQIW